ncbi:hypothetical protein Droror1_Dr00027844 [Drosera rotundifolia]
MNYSQSQIKPHPQPQWRSIVEHEMYYEKKQFVDVEKMDTEEVVEVVDDELQERQVETTPNQPPALVVDANREVGLATGLKLPKSKAKEPNKREMTMSEKHRLGTGLQNLPDEEMDSTVDEEVEASGFSISQVLDMSEATKEVIQRLIT